MRKERERKKKNNANIWRNEEKELRAWRKKHTERRNSCDQIGWNRIFHLKTCSRYFFLLLTLCAAVFLFLHLNLLMLLSCTSNCYTSFQRYQSGQFSVYVCGSAFSSKHFDKIDGSASERRNWMDEKDCCTKSGIDYLWCAREMRLNANKVYTIYNSI